MSVPGPRAGARNRPEIRAWNHSGPVEHVMVVIRFTPAFREERPEVLQWAGEMLRSSPPEGYAGCCEAIRDADLRSRLGGISAPTLVIAGADDPAAPVEKAEIIRDGIPNSRLVVIERAAHIANVERPDEVTGEILNYLEPIRKGG